MKNILRLSRQFPGSLPLLLGSARLCRLASDVLHEDAELALERAEEARWQQQAHAWVNS